MKIFAFKRWLLAIPLLLLSLALWRAKEARSWVPRNGPLYLNPFPASNLTQLPIVWRDNGVWILRPDTVNTSAQENTKSVVNWNSAPVALHFPDKNLDAAMTVSGDGRNALKPNQFALELWRDGRRVATMREPKRHNSNGELNPSPPTLLAIAPNGKRWANASHLNGLFSDEPNALASDGITLWDAAAKRDIARLNAQLGSITALEFSPDSRLLAAVAADGYAFIWNANDGKLVRRWRAHPWVAASLAWSPDGQTLLTGANPRLSHAGGLTISSINRVSVSFGGQGTMTGDAGTDAHPMKLKVDAKDDLTINGQTDRSLRLWNVQSGQLLRQWESKTGICSAQFSPDGREIAVGTHGQALIMEAATLKIKRRLPMPDYPKWPASIAWSPDGKTLAVACAPQLTLWRAH